MDKMPRVGCGEGVYQALSRLSTVPKSACAHQPRSSLSPGFYGAVRPVAQLCPTLCSPMDCSPPGSSVQRILQARILEWGVISSSRGSSQSKGQTLISCIGRRVLYHLANREAGVSMEDSFHSHDLLSHWASVD